MSGTKKSQAIAPRLIGITGGIATGKTTTTAYLRSKKYPVICADEISHQLTRKNSAGWKEIRKTFGKDVFLKTGELDRVRLADLVFKDVLAKQQLEKILHPMVRAEMIKQIKRATKNKKNIFIFLDVPLLFESGLDSFCDATICVYASQRFQIARLKKYRNMTRAQVLARIRSQLPMRLKIQKSSHVIRNTGSKKQLFSQIDQILKEIR